jgi:hypothetical protein
MMLQVIGAGLPRTGTASLVLALNHLLGGEIHHMRVIPDHPFDLGEGWNQALRGETPDWHALFTGYIAAVDWPASHFWRELSEVYPDALVLLSVRDSAKMWWESANATFLPYARLGLAPDWPHGQGLQTLLAQFAGTEDWNDTAVLQAAYQKHNEAVRQTIPPHRLLEWQVGDGWAPICQALGMAVPERPFPWVNRRSEWGD